MNNYRQCVNCENGSHKFIRGYCSKCYPIILKIDKLNNGLDIYKLFINSNYSEKDKKNMLNECIRQLRVRLEDLRDANVLRERVTAHELELQINNTIRSFGKKGFPGRYGLGKINDYLEFDFRTNDQKIYLYRLFAMIKILNQFKIDYWKVYNIKK